MRQHDAWSKRQSPRGARVEALEDRRLLAAFDVLVFSRTLGFRHDSIDDGIAAIRQLGAANDFTVAATEDPAAFVDANLAPYEAVVFLNTTGDVLNPTQQASFERFIASGRGYVGIHSAADTEYDWPWYGGLVGAYFQSHPAIQQATIKVADRAHPATAPLPQRWTRTDEWYNYRANPRAGVHVLATLDETTYSGGSMGFDHPIAWCQEYAGGRSFYTGLGHTDASYSESLFRQHLLGGIRYAAGATIADDGPTISANFRKTVLDEDTLNPFQLDIAADGRVFYIERGGRVKRWDPTTGAAATIGTIPVFSGAEDGLLGLALDPNFTTNRWLYLLYAAPTPAEQHVSRFSLNAAGQIDMASERILLRIPVQRTHSNHSAGSLGFGPDGLLYVALGDNTSPFESDGFAPIDERPGRSDWDAQKSASNTNDLRGKILRIRPEADGTYTIPAGNLFPGDGSGGRPEIYVMGVRNPFRFSVDPETNRLYWGDVGPDANDASPTRGPRGYDEINQARGPGNFGWPYFISDNKPYVDYDFATGTSGAAFNPAAPVNNSPNNTGAQSLPPAQPSWIWYPYAASTTFPQLGTGGRTAMAGPVYHYDATRGSEFKLPAYYDDTLFIYEWSRNWIKEVKIDAATGAVHQINPFAPGMTFKRPMDMKIGPDGAMYLIEWGTSFGGNNADSQIVRVEYLNNPSLGPEISQVYVRGSTWSSAFKTYMESQGLGDKVYGYRVDHAISTDVVPWLNVNEIVLKFNRAPLGGIPQPGGLILDGIRSDYAIESITQIDPTTYALRPNRALGLLPGGGENGDRVNVLVAGGGPNGTAYSLTINVLQGDVDKSGTVLAQDYSAVKRRFFRSTAMPGPAGDDQYTVFHDLDGSGSILANDYSAVKARFFDDLPPAPATFAPRLSRSSLTADLLAAFPAPPWANLTSSKSDPG